MLKLKTLVKQNKGLVVFILLMSVFRSAIADWNTVPTGSMLPTIVEGDRIGINKLAYDVKLPFINHTIARLAEPKRGEIIVFESNAADVRLVKRVIGLPGDSVAMENNQLFINDQAVGYRLDSAPATKRSHGVTYAIESLPGKPHPIQLINDRASDFDSFDRVIVPADMYLVLGDNRRASADSRVYGLVPRQEILGRAENVVLSFNYDNYYIPRANRIWRPLI